MIRVRLASAQEEITEVADTHQPLLPLLQIISGLSKIIERL